jgi:hypothetical protein
MALPSTAYITLTVFAMTLTVPGDALGGADQGDEMAGQTTEVLSLRLDASIMEMLQRLTLHFRVSDSFLVERLIVTEAIRVGLMNESHPSACLIRLLDLVAMEVDRIGANATPDLTRAIAEWIPTNPDAGAAYRGALVPVGTTPERRRQFVNQRLGRFVKEHSGRVSGEEVTLPRDAGLIIKGYTRLYPA